MLLVADAAVTLARQEPISAFVALRKQAKLDDQLDDLTRSVTTRRVTTRPDRPARAASARSRAGPSAESSCRRSTGTT
jgi:hypothetical protein